MKGLFEFLHFLGLGKPEAPIPPPINPNRLFLVRKERRFFLVEVDYPT